MNIVRLRKQRVNKEMLSMDLFEKCYNYTTAKEAIATECIRIFTIWRPGRIQKLLWKVVLLL